MYPKKVKIKIDGDIILMPYKEIIEHEEDIIQDNIFYGYKNGYDEKEINGYERDAMIELKALKKAIRENHDVTLVMNNTTQRYEVLK